ncbi:hypothetical protein HYT23_06765 [Candidatus Pacearchaeota archaeon]|nr:hypothetical protein [Candidatus Pacearchaeota archaeon]
MKTIGIPEDLHKELIRLKLDGNDKNVADTLRKIIYTYKQNKFIEFGMLFRQKLKESGKNFDDFLKESRKIREEIADEWF